MFVNGVESNFLVLNSGALQESILGPHFLFLMYINDLVKSNQLLFCTRLFADDTSLIATGKDLQPWTNCVGKCLKTSNHDQKPTKTASCTPIPPFNVGK